MSSITNNYLNLLLVHIVNYPTFFLYFEGKLLYVDGSVYEGEFK